MTEKRKDSGGEAAPNVANSAAVDAEIEGQAEEAELERLLARYLAKVMSRTRPGGGKTRPQPRPGRPGGDDRRPVYVPVPGGSGATPSLDRLVDDSLRSLLGVVPKPGDPQALVDALNRVLVRQEVEGRVEWKLQPVSYSARLDTSESLSGVQASLYSRARERLKTAIPVLDALRGIGRAADEEAVDASRALLRTKWEQFVKELGDPDGPNFARADQLEREIFYSDATTDTYGYLARLGVELGIYERVGNKPKLDPAGRPIVTRGGAITKKDDRVLTEFLLLQGDIETTFKEYAAYKDLLKDDLGTRVATIKRLLSTIEDTLDELTTSLELIQLDSVERETVTVSGTIGGRAYSVSLEDLIAWVRDFVRSEAIQLMDQAGRWGVKALKPTAALLSALAAEAPDAVDAATGLDTTAANAALAELKRYLDEVTDEAGR